MKQLILRFLSLLVSFQLFAKENNDVLFSKGIKAFNQKDYETSAQIFENLLNGDSLNATLHYNLGTSYLRLQNTPLSIYHLEKALKIKPEYEPARINLHFAEKLKTKITTGNLPIPQKQMLYSVFNFLQPNTWAYLAIATMLITVIALVSYRLITNVTSKKVLFTLSIFTLLVSLGCYFVSRNQSNYLLTNNYVIVNNKDVLLMNEPRTVAKIYSNLPQGEKGFIQEETNQWIKIQLPNDSIGWVEKNKVLKF